MSTARRSVVALALAVVVGLTGVPAASAVPAPDPSAGSEQLQAELDRLAPEVERLEVQAELAIEAYNEVRAELDVLMQQEISAQVELDDAGRRLSQERRSANQRVRALYRTGGSTQIAWVSLSSGGLVDAATTYRVARTVLTSDAAIVARSRDQVVTASDTSSRFQTLRRQRAELEKEAEQRRLAAETALRDSAALLARTDDALVRALEQERQAAERLALEEALAAAARAEAAAAAAAAVGPGGGSVAPGSLAAAGDQQAVIDRAAANAPNERAAAAIRSAATRLGAPYVWGATGSGSFDCSGLTLWAYNSAGVSMPRTSRQQYAGLPRVAVGSLLPGDLVFYADGPDPTSIHHVGLYLGDGLMLHAPRTGDVVKISALWGKPMFGAVRPTG